MEQITASCVIRKNHLFLNGRLLWKTQPAPLADFLLSAYHRFGFQYPKFYKMDQLGKIGWLAAELLLSEGFNATDYRPEDVAVVISNANSSLDTDYKYFATVGDIPSPALFVYTLPNIMIGEICIRHQFKGENAFFIAETFDAGFIVEYVCDLMASGNARACICGWVDVLGEDYSAALFLIERKSATLPFTADKLPFTADNMNILFNIQNAGHE
jgi:3-oxoacyl-(acyl-carrier-protein) synthase